MSANPFFITTDENPNEAFGVRACSFAGQQKSADCGGQWNTWHSVSVGRSPFAPRLTVCDVHLAEAAAARKPLKAKRTRIAADVDVNGTLTL